MGTVRFRFDPAATGQLSPEEEDRLASMTEEEVQRNAEADPDNPPLSPDELDRLSMARRIQLVRRATGLSQARFAERFRINPARLRDWERGRFMPDSVALAYLAVIERDRAAVERALAEDAAS